MDLSWIEAQRAVLGSLLMAPDRCAGEIFQGSTPACFSDPAMRHIYEAALGVWERNEPLDAVTVLAAAGDNYRKTIVEAMELTPTWLNFAAYLQICRKEARLSSMRTAAMSITTADTEEEALEAFERLGQAVQGTGHGRRITLTEMIGGYLDAMHSKERVDYLDWGMDKLNRTLFVSRGQFGVIAADSSSGKTALALQFAVQIAKTGKRVGFISLETPEESLRTRLMAEHQVAGIPMPRTQKKELTDDDFVRAGEAGQQLSGVVMDTFLGYYSLQEIRAVTVQNRLDVVFIDYLQLINGPGRERWEIVTGISMALHRMAQQLGVIVIGLSQITPAVKGQKAPTKDDLRESRQLKQDADFILLLYPDTEQDAPANARVLEIAKNKDGRLGRVRLGFEPEFMSFSERAPSVQDMRVQGTIAKARAWEKPAAKDQESVPMNLAPGQMVPMPDDGEEDLPF